MLLNAYVNVNQKCQIKSEIVIHCTHIDYVCRCRAVLFGIERDEANDNQLDTVLLRACKDEIDSLCAKAPLDKKLKCLRVCCLTILDYNNISVCLASPQGA
jgi:hypothetical protein